MSVLLDRTDAFLKTRNGIDKSLKVICYASKWYAFSLAAKTPAEDARALSRRAAALGSACSDARAAMRLGKFLGNIRGLRDALSELAASSSSTSPQQKSRDTMLKLATVLCELGEGAHYFVEQARWLARRGVIDKKHAEPLLKLAATLELVGYAGELPMLFIKWGNAAAIERACRAKATARDADASSIVKFSKEAAQARGKGRRLMLEYLAVLADAAVALGDLGVSERLAHPPVEAAFSLFSALVNGGLKF
ncbi:H(+)-exporting diphosphatase [Pseudoscourfieldia marina]